MQAGLVLGRPQLSQFADDEVDGLSLWVRAYAGLVQDAGSGVGGLWLALVNALDCSADVSDKVLEFQMCSSFCCLTFKMSRAPHHGRPGASAPLCCQPAQQECKGLNLYDLSATDPALLLDDVKRSTADERIPFRTEREQVGDVFSRDY